MEGWTLRMVLAAFATQISYLLFKAEDPVGFVLYVIVGAYLCISATVLFLAKRRREATTHQSKVDNEVV